MLITHQNRANINNIRSIKGLLNQTNLIQQILAIIQEGVFKSNPDAIFALGFMTRWISDISFLQNEDLLIRIFSYNCYCKVILFAGDNFSDFI